MEFRPRRYRTEFPITFKTPNGSVKAIINDVNDTGALVTSDALLQRGQKISMQFLNHRVDAIVRWSLRGKYGIVFRPMLTIAQVDVLRQRSGSHGTSERHSSASYASYAEMR